MTEGRAKPETPAQTDYERIGGNDGVHGIVTTFMAKVYDDTIIGFFFDNIDRDHLIAREVELAAAHLGGPKEYKGRPLARAHRAHPINPGHFHRRLYLLEQALREHGVNDAIIERWLEHDRKLKPAVVSQPDCLD